MGKLIRLRNVSLVESFAFEGDAPSKRRTKDKMIGWWVSAPRHGAKFYRGVSRADAVKAYKVTTGELPDNVKLEVKQDYLSAEEIETMKQRQRQRTAVAESLDTTARRLRQGTGVAPVRPKPLALVESRVNRPAAVGERLDELARRLMSG